MEHAVVSNSTMTSNDKVQNKLIEEAKSKGADAILITVSGNHPAQPVMSTQRKIN